MQYNLKSSTHLSGVKESETEELKKKLSCNVRETREFCDKVAVCK